MPFARDLGSATPTEDLAGLVPALHFGGLWLKLRRGQSHAKEGWRFQQGPGRRRATCNVTLMIQCSRGFRLQEKQLSRKRDGVGEELDLSQSWTVGRRCAKIDTCAAGGKSMTHCWAGRRSLPERPGGQTSTQPSNSHSSPAASARVVAANSSRKTRGRIQKLAQQALVCLALQHASCTESYQMLPEFWARLRVQGSERAVASRSERNANREGRHSKQASPYGPALCAHLPQVTRLARLATWRHASFDNEEKRQKGSQAHIRRHTRRKMRLARALRSVWATDDDKCDSGNLCVDKQTERAHVWYLRQWELLEQTGLLKTWQSRALLQARPEAADGHWRRWCVKLKRQVKDR